MGQPLKNLLVVSLEQAVAAPFCSSRLADAGARVIKLEREEGDFARDYDQVVDGESSYFVWLNRGKESLCINIKDPADQTLLYKLIAEADVFIQNLAPGAAARCGLDSQGLRARHPRLITVDISGYGESGPYSKMKAYDLLVQCESGLASITGAPEQPGRVGVSICDIACGMYAHAAVLEALLERGQTGQGKGIKVSLFDTIADWMTVPLLHQVYGGKAPSRVGLNHPSIAPYGVYTCNDGQIVIAIQNNREWAQLCTKVLKRPDLITNSHYRNNVDRCANRPQLDTEINQEFAKLSLDQLINLLQEAKVAFARLNSIFDLANHPQLRQVQVPTPNGSIELVAPPAIQVDETRHLGSVPALGQHSEAIRAEFSDDEYKIELSQ